MNYRVNNGDYHPSSAPAPRVSPERVQFVIWGLTIGGFLAIGADCWMSWEGFKTLPISWWVAATLTGLVALSQLGSGVIQGLGGNPFRGIGGSSDGDGIWGLSLRALYGLDIFSNFAGFGGTAFLPNSLWELLTNPLGLLGSMGNLLWYLLLAVLLAFGDEILFRLRDRIEIGSQRNQALARMRKINVQAHERTLSHYEKNAMAYADQQGQELQPSFDWITQDNV